VTDRALFACGSSPERFTAHAPHVASVFNDDMRPVIANRNRLG
jgi:hypothetical protein